MMGIGAFCSHFFARTCIVWTSGLHPIHQKVSIDLHRNDLRPWLHSHDFGQDQRRPGETRTMVVIAITSAMMIVEIAAGILFGSMALLADGLHMASHAAALSINAFAYVYARKHAHDARFSFGTGKVNSLGGFTGAILLAIFALIMVVESLERMVNPVEIAFNQSIFVAIVGLVVNGASVLILGHHDHHHEHSHGGHHHHELHVGEHRDHNLRAAYLHVLADALTSLLAIAALLAAKYMHLIWMDPLVGILGAFLVSRWSLGLLRTTSSVLLDSQGPEEIRNAIRTGVEADGDSRVVDLHVWLIGPEIYSVLVSVVAHNPRQPVQYKEALHDLGLAHVTVEVQQCREDGIHEGVQVGSGIE